MTPGTLEKNSLGQSLEEKCQGQFCDLVRSLDPRRDLLFPNNSSSDSAGAGTINREVERSNERDRASRMIRWVLSETEASKLEESGKLIQLRVTGRIDPFSFGTVPAESVVLARKEHRLAFAMLAHAEDSALISEDDWKELVATHWGRDRVGTCRSDAHTLPTAKPPLGRGGTTCSDEVTVCGVCHHVYRLLDRVRQLLNHDAPGGRANAECTIGKAVPLPSKAEPAAGHHCTEDDRVQLSSVAKKKLTKNVKRPVHISSKGIKESRRKVASNAGTSPGPPASHIKPRKKRKRVSVLVSDHDEASMAVASEHLKAEEYALQAVSNGLDCIRMLEAATSFDIILVAKDLASRDAFEITKWLRDRHENCDQEPIPQIVILTSDTTQEELRSYVDAGIDGCLQKPVDGSKLVTVVREAATYLSRARKEKTKQAIKGKDEEEGKAHGKRRAKAKRSSQKRPSIQGMKEDEGRSKADKCADNNSNSKAGEVDVKKEESHRKRIHPPAVRAEAANYEMEKDDPNSYSGVLECDAATSLPYTILDSSCSKSQETATGCSSKRPTFNLVVCHDVFDTLERMKIFFSPLVARYPGIQVLLWNYPGQAFTTFPDGALLNNEFHSSCLEKLMLHVGPQGHNKFNTNHPFFVMGHGSGGAIATYYAATQRPPSLRGLLLINGLSFVDPHYASVFHDCTNVFGCAPETRPDLPIYFYSRFIFSQHYLSKTSAPLALNLYTAVHNPISLRGRVQLCVGVLNHVDIRPLLNKVASPVISIHGEQSSLVRPLHAKSYLDGRRGSKSIHQALKGGVNRTTVILIKGGHELFQEQKKGLATLTEQLLTGYHETNDGPNPWNVHGTERGPQSQVEGGTAQASASPKRYPKSGTSKEGVVANAHKKSDALSFEDKFIDSVVEATRRANGRETVVNQGPCSAWTDYQLDATKRENDPHKHSPTKEKKTTKKKTKNVHAADASTSENAFSTLIDPTNPAFERQDNTIYKIGGNSAIYPDPRDYPEVSEYMSWRLKRNRNRLLRLDRAARIIQGALRVFMARTMLSRLKRQSSALTIQRCYRGLQGRIVFLQRRKELWAARFVQRSIRGHLGRSKSHLRRRMMEAQIKLARRWRGTKARNVVRALIARRHLAATYVQCLWRRCKAKSIATFHRNRRDASIVLERMYRGHRGRRKADREREKYLFSRSQSSGIELGRQMLAEHKLHATRLQSEISLLNREKQTMEEQVDVLLEEISQFEETVKSLEKEMHALSKAERENAAVLKSKLKHELREQKIRLDQEFSSMLTRIADRKEQLKDLEKKLGQLGRSRHLKNEEMKTLERKLVVLLEAQETQLQDIRRRQEKEYEKAVAAPGCSNDRNDISGDVEMCRGHQGPSVEEKQQAAQLMDSTETMMKFGFMSMSMTYFSSLNMVRAMKKVAVQDTVMAAASQMGSTGPPGTSTIVAGGEERSSASTAPAPPMGGAIRNSGYSDSMIRNWTVDDVLKWLSAISLGQYSDAFREGAVDGIFLCQLADDDLRSTLGVEHKLHRKKILFSIGELRDPPESGQSAGEHMHVQVAPVTERAEVWQENPKQVVEEQGSLHQPSAPPTASNLPSSSAQQSVVEETRSRNRADYIGPNKRTSLDEMEPRQTSAIPPTPSLEELSTWVRNKRIDLLTEALESVPSKPFDETSLRVQFVEDVGTAYTELYERESFNLNKQDDHGNTLLHVAAQNGNLRVAKLLVHKGANPNHQNKQGQTPGHFAIAYQFYDFASWLFDAEGGTANDLLMNMYGLGPYDGLGAP